MRLKGPPKEIATFTNSINSVPVTEFFGHIARGRLNLLTGIIERRFSSVIVVSYPESLVEESVNNSKVRGRKKLVILSY